MSLWKRINLGNLASCEVKGEKASDLQVLLKRAIGNSLTAVIQAGIQEFGNEGLQRAEPVTASAESARPTQGSLKIIPRKCLNFDVFQ